MSTAASSAANDLRIKVTLLPGATARKTSLKGSVRRTPGQAVENLLNVSAFPVHGPTREIFFAPLAPDCPLRALCVRFRGALRLCRAHTCIESHAFPSEFYATPTPVSSAVHRYEQSIAGRPYLIEVVEVARDRWRAYIVRIPGVPSELI